MNVSQIFNYNGADVSFIKGMNGLIYLNATQMAKPFGKIVHEWLRLPSTKELISYTGKSLIRENQLVITKQGGPEYGGGTWLAEDIAIDFAQWLDVRFRLWCNERIRELIHHGITATEHTIEKLLEDPKSLIVMLQKLQDEREANEILRQEAQVNAPKVLFADSVSASDSCILVGQLAKILKQNGMDTGEKRLFKKLRAEGYLCSKGQNHNMPTQKAMGMKLFELKEQTYQSPNGNPKITLTVKVTGKGQQYFINKFIKKA